MTALSPPPAPSLTLQDLDHPEPLAIKPHVRREFAPPGEILGVRLAPIGERTIAFALVMGEGGVDLPEPPPVSSIVSRIAPGRPRPSLTIQRLPTTTPLSPSLAAQQVAVFLPMRTSSISSSASSGVSPNAKLSSSTITYSPYHRHRCGPVYSRIRPSFGPPFVGRSPVVRVTVGPCPMRWRRLRERGPLAGRTGRKEGGRQ